MARRGHFSFDKRQKEIRQKEKQQKKVARRLAKRDQSPPATVTGTAPQAAFDETEETDSSVGDEQVDQPDHKMLRPRFPGLDR